MKNKKNILFLTTSYPRYPEDIAGSFLVPLIEALKKNYQIKIVAPEDIVSTPSDDVERFRYFYPKRYQQLAYGNGIPENLQKNPLLYLLFPFLTFGMLIKAFSLSKACDVIISSWLFPSGIVGATLSFLTKRPHILIEHSAGAHFLKKLPFNRVLLRFVSRYTSKFVVVSPYLVDIFQHIGDIDTSLFDIIPMGIDLEQYNIPVNRLDTLKKYNLSEDAINVLFVGRLVEIKGLDILIKSLKNIENVALIVLGDGINMDYYKNMAISSKVNANFPGKITGKDKIDLINSSDIVVIPSKKLKSSRVEGTPVLIMEAMACGKIIVASNTGGIPYIIQDGINGKLFNPENENELRNIILEIVKNKHLYYKFAEEAKISSQVFDIKTISNRYCQLIEEVSKND